jgi:hypothetical protein
VLADWLGAAISPSAVAHTDSVTVGSNRRPGFTHEVPSE